MKSSLLGLIVLLLVQAGGQAQAPEPWPGPSAWKLFASDPEQPPRKVAHNFGAVDFGTQVTHRFSVTNHYKMPLKITVEPSNNCVKAKANPQTLKPKQSGFIEVNMDTSRFIGPKSVALEVTVSDGSYCSTTAITLSATSRSDVALTPAEVNFEKVQQSHKSVKQMNVDYQGRMQDWRITGADTNGAPLAITPGESSRQATPTGFRVSYRVAMTLKTTIEASVSEGEHKWEVFLQTNDPAHPRVPISVSAIILGDVSIERDEKQPGKPIIAVTLQTPVTQALVEEMKGHKALRTLTLKGKSTTRHGSYDSIGVTDEGLENLRELRDHKALSRIEFRYTEVTDAGLAIVKEFQQLEELDLWCNDNLTDTGLKHLEGLKRLKWLAVDQKKVTDAGIRALTANKQLEKLMLCDTQITDAGLKEVANLRQLKDLYISSAVSLTTVD